MKKRAVLAVASLLSGFSACGDADDLTGMNSCANLSGNFVATTFTATGTANAALTNNFLADGGAFSLTFNDGGFTSSHTASTGAVPITHTSTFSTSGTNSITLGNQALFAGGASGAQTFTCTRSGNTITLTAPNTSYMFAGNSSAHPARINITLANTAGA